jgi:hypothetical protein
MELQFYTHVNTLIYYHNYTKYNAIVDFMNSGYMYNEIIEIINNELNIAIQELAVNANPANPNNYGNPPHQNNPNNYGNPPHQNNHINNNIAQPYINNPAIINQYQINTINNQILLNNINAINNQIILNNQINDNDNEIYDNPNEDNNNLITTPDEEFNDDFFDNPPPPPKLTRH